MPQQENLSSTATEQQLQPQERHGIVNTVLTGAENVLGAVVAPVKGIFRGVPETIDQFRTFGATLEDKPDEKANTVAKKMLRYAQIDVAYDIDQQSSEDEKILTKDERDLIAEIRKLRAEQMNILQNPPRIVDRKGRVKQSSGASVQESMYSATKKEPLSPEDDVEINLAATGQSAIAAASDIEDMTLRKFVPKKVYELSDEIHNTRTKLTDSLNEFYAGTDGATTSRRQEIHRALKEKARQRGEQDLDPLKLIQEKIDSYYKEIRSDLNSRLRADIKQFGSVLGFTARNAAILGVTALFGKFLPLVNNANIWLEQHVGESIDLTGLVNTIAGFVGIDPTVSANVGSHNWWLIGAGSLALVSLGLGTIDAVATLGTNVAQQSKLRWRFGADRRASRKEMNSLQQEYATYNTLNGFANRRFA